MPPITTSEPIATQSRFSKRVLMLVASAVLFSIVAALYLHYGKVVRFKNETEKSAYEQDLAQKSMVSPGEPQVITYASGIPARSSISQNTIIKQIEGKIIASSSKEKKVVSVNEVESIIKSNQVEILKAFLVLNKNATTVTSTSTTHN